MITPNFVEATTTNGDAYKSNLKKREFYWTNILYDPQIKNTKLLPQRLSLLFKALRLTNSKWKCVLSECSMWPHTQWNHLHLNKSDLVWAYQHRMPNGHHHTTYHHTNEKNKTSRRRNTTTATSTNNQSTTAGHRHITSSSEVGVIR